MSIQGRHSRLRLKANPDTELDEEAIFIVNKYVVDNIQTILTKADSLTDGSHQSTITWEEIETACKDHFPVPQLFYVISAGRKAVSKYSGSE